MVLMICKNCGKNIAPEDLKSNNLIDISKCPCCGNPISDMEKVKMTKAEQNLDDLAIARMIEERDQSDNGKRYTLEEVRAMRKERKRK